MCFLGEDTGAAQDLRFEAGPWAIERFIDDPVDCRFLQSFKTFAASRSFTETHIHGRKFTFEDLLTAFIEKCALTLAARLMICHRVWSPVGRLPLQGVNLNEALALERYQRAFSRVGFGEILYVYEPVAAAYFFAQRLAGRPLCWWPISAVVPVTFRSSGLSRAWVRAAR